MTSECSVYSYGLNSCRFQMLSHVPKKIHTNCHKLKKKNDVQLDEYSDIYIAAGNSAND
jgi:hypothetical protein